MPRTLPIDRTSTRKAREILSKPVKRALLLMHREGTLVATSRKWMAENGEAVFFRTVRTLYDRCLVKIVVESRSRHRHLAMLTEIGDHVARDLARTAEEARLYPVSESASLAITEAVSADAFENAAEVYEDERQEF